MRARRGTYARGLSAAVSAGCMIGLAIGASASEYYSWIDRSGTMVLTDDLGTLPPPPQRSAVTVHSFPERPPAPAQLPGPPPDSDQAKQKESPNSSPQEEPGTASAPRRADPTNLDLPTVMLDSPAEGIKWQYAWVPLTMPMYQGGTAFNGFWAHHSITSPFAALHEFLQRNAGQPRGNALVGNGMVKDHQRQVEIPSEVRFMRGLLALSERMPSASHPFPHWQHSPQAGSSRPGPSGAGR